MQDNSRDLYECVVISSHAVVVDDYDDVARHVACSFISSSSSSTSSIIHQIIRLSVATVVSPSSSPFSGQKGNKIFSWSNCFRVRVDRFGGNINYFYVLLLPLLFYAILQPQITLNGQGATKTVPMFDHDQAACYDLTLIFQSFQRTPKMVPQRPRSRAAQLRPPQPGLRATISRIWSKSVHRPSISLSSAKTVNSGNVSATAPRASPRWPLPSTMSQKRW